MATCDVWKQTHKNFQNVSSTTATSMLTQEELFTWYRSFCKDDQSEDHLSTNGKSESISNFLYSSDVSSISDGTVKNVCSDDEMNINIVASRGDLGLDDTVFDMCNSDENKDVCENDFNNTYYNCIPVWEMEQQQQQVQHQQVEVIHNNNKIMVEDDPCTMNVLKHNFEHKNYGAHSVSFVQLQLNSDADGTNSVPDEIVQQEYVFNNKFPFDVKNDTSMDKLEIELLDGIFIPSTLNCIDDSICNKNYSVPFVQPQLNDDGDEYGASIIQTDINSEVYGAHNVQIAKQQLNNDDAYGPSTVQNDISCDTDGAHNISDIHKNIDSVSIGLTQQKDKVVKNLDIQNLSMNNRMEDVVLPFGFYSLQPFIDDMIFFRTKFGDKIGVLLSSLNELELVFINNNHEYVYRPFTMSDDFDPDGKFYPVNRLLDVLDDLNIEYGDMIGISSYGKLQMLLLKNSDKLLAQDSRYNDLRSLNFNKNLRKWKDKQKRPFKNYKRKRGKKKKRYKWIVKNKLQHPVLKTFGEYNSIGNISISSTDTQSIMVNNSDYCNADNIDSRALSDQINISCGGDSEYGSPLNSIKVITAPAPPRDPDGIY